MCFRQTTLRSFPLWASLTVDKFILIWKSVVISPFECSVLNVYANSDKSCNMTMETGPYVSKAHSVRAAEVEIPMFISFTRWRHAFSSERFMNIQRVWYSSNVYSMFIRWRSTRCNIPLVIRNWQWVFNNLDWKLTLRKNPSYDKVSATFNFLIENFETALFLIWIFLLWEVFKIARFFWE